MRDRLIELLKKADERCEKCKQCQECVAYGRGEDCINYLMVDHLLENGVIVPPMKLGQTYFEPCNYLNTIDECRVYSITQKEDGTFKIRLTNLRGKWVFEITADNIGKTVFLTKEEAEKALAERSKE